MKITVITGSPHKKGTSALLADELIRGAREAGNDVFRFDAAFEKLHPCQGCDRCGMGSSPCIWEDSMEKLNPHLLEAEVVVLVTPLYYFTVSAQLKTVIDRFYANTGQLTGNKKVILMATAYDANDWTMHALTEYYRTLASYMQWESLGTILAAGCGNRRAIERSDFPRQAYEMGKSLK